MELEDELLLCFGYQSVRATVPASDGSPSGGDISLVVEIRESMVGKLFRFEPDFRRGFSSGPCPIRRLGQRPSAQMAVCFQHEVPMALSRVISGHL